MPKMQAIGEVDATKYYAFAMAVTGGARAELREKILARLAEAVEADHQWRARCRDTDVRAATRIRPWCYTLTSSS